MLPSNWGDYGLAGLILGLVLPLIIWWVKAARTDIKESYTSARVDLKESHDEFTKYIKDQGNRQTEAIVASANATAQSVKALENLSSLMVKHEERAAIQHQTIMDNLDAAVLERKDISVKIDNLDTDITTIARGKPDGNIH